YESILVDPQFSVPFLKKLLGKNCSIDDLGLFDEELYQNLMKLKSLSPADFDALELSFETMSTVDRFGNYLGPTPVPTPLIPNGSDVPVTADNALRYIFCVSHHKLNVETGAATRAFLAGFRQVIPASYIKMFSARELQKVIGGSQEDAGIDIADLQATVVYSGGYHPSQPIIQWLWEVVTDMTPDEQRKFLKFITSCSRRPLLGFKSLAPCPAIQKIRDVGGEEGGGGERLPTAATCMNLLKVSARSEASAETDRFDDDI
ncbi:hypothetical protein TeGR_g9811, partial [Tetraparma gracilis]